MLTAQSVNWVLKGCQHVGNRVLTRF